MTPRMLLIEDSDDDVELTTHALQEVDFKCDLAIARSGEEALEYLLCTDELPKVALLDLNLSGTSGLEVLRRIRENERTRLLPVVILTSSSHDRDVIDSYRLGANGYIQKPVSFVDFIEATRRIVLYWLSLNRTPSHASR